MNDLTWSIEEVGDDDEAIEAYAEAIKRLDERVPGSVTADDVRHSDRATGVGGRWAARVASEIVALGAVSGAPHDPGSRVLPAYVIVDAAHRRRGIGGELYGLVLDWARTHRDDPELMVSVPERVPDAVAWWQRRGLAIEERFVTLELDLADIDPPPGRTIEGVRMASLEDRPDLEAAAYAEFVACWRDMPGVGHMQPPPADTWTEKLREGRRSPGAWSFAIDEATDEVLGICTTVLDEGDELAHTSFTGVATAARGRGIARALKDHQLAWCIAQGATKLRTNNHEDNAAMRRVNESMGYLELPADLLLVGVPTEAGARA